AGHVRASRYVFSAIEINGGAGPPLRRRRHARRQRHANGVGPRDVVVGAAAGSGFLRRAERSDCWEFECQQ
ncbi:unnamed protein product, partial [Polarella glacialis]